MPTSGTLVAHDTAEREVVDESGRLLVTWRNPLSRSYHVVGALDRSSSGFTFVYFERAKGLEGFRPFLGFSKFEGRYESRHLFPIFRERLMSSARPDLDAWLAALGLDRHATEFEMLARSGGTRIGDTIEMIAQPSIGDDGRTSSAFLVHGVRYLPGAADSIADLRAGEDLLLIQDAENPVNPRALQVTATDRRPFGWVPEPLLEYARQVCSSGEARLSVIRANGPDVGPRLQLLVRLDGIYPGSRAPFTGPQWQTLA